MRSIFAYESPKPIVNPPLKISDNLLNSSIISFNIPLNTVTSPVGFEKSTASATLPPTADPPLDPPLSESDPEVPLSKLNLLIVSTPAKAFLIFFAADSPFLPVSDSPLPRLSAASVADDRSVEVSASADPPPPVVPEDPVSISIRDAKESARGCRLASTQLIPLTIGVNTAMNPLPKLALNASKRNAKTLVWLAQLS